MDRYSFSLLPIEYKISILQTEAELLTIIPSDHNIIKLYTYNGFLIEDYRDTEKHTLINIDAIMPNAESERLKVYSRYIKYVNNSFKLEISRERESAMLVCLNCDYEWVQDNSTKPEDICCPVCEIRKWTFLFKKECKSCNTIYYSNGSSHKRGCPKCK